MCKIIKAFQPNTKMYYIQMLLVLFAVISCTRQDVQGHFKKKDPVDPKLMIPPDPEHLNDSIELNMPKPDEHQKPKVDNNIKLNSTSSANNNSSKEATNPNAHKLPEPEEVPKSKPMELESGALRRGILVFVAISFFFILYAGFKTYRGKKRDKSRTIVRKYGVRTKRSDLEMEPLPLSDDEEDETLFDLTTSRSSNQ